MSAGLFKAPTSNFWSTSLNGAINSSVDTITLNSTTGLQAPGYLIIDREDNAGTATSTSREIIKFTGIAGNDITGVTRAADGSTARSHSDGALVEAVFTIGMHNDQRDTINAEHNTNGTHGVIANATITTTNIVNAVISTATITNANLVRPIGVSGQFLWTRSGALTTVLNATASDTHFPLQRASKNLTLTSFYGSLLSAPSIKPLELDISYNSLPTGVFTSIFSVKPFIDIGEYTTGSAATASTLALTSLASGSFLRFEVRMHGGSGGLTGQLMATERD